MRCRDVAEEVLRFDEVVAGVDVTVVLERNRAPAGLRKDADAGGRCIQDASAASKIWTKTSPTSCPIHSSKTSMRKRPHCVARTERSLTAPGSPGLGARARRLG